jgi:hypothetical protein
MGGKTGIGRGKVHGGGGHVVWVWRYGDGR